MIYKAGNKSTYMKLNTQNSLNLNTQNVYS